VPNNFIGRIYDRRVLRTLGRWSRGLGAGYPAVRSISL
jgi:hypothetical protein